MLNRLTLSAVLAATLLSAPAFAAGEHAGGHDEMAVGAPADPGTSARQIKVSMTETSGGKMLYTPNQIRVSKGETIRISITNNGEVPHEFVMDEEAKNQEHKALMEKFPEMEHDDANAVRLEPGESSDILWTFTNAGKFEFACLIPGHYEAGMHGPLIVAGQ